MSQSEEPRPHEKLIYFACVVLGALIGGSQAGGDWYFISFYGGIGGVAGGLVARVLLRVFHSREQ